MFNLAMQKKRKKKSFAIRMDNIKVHVKSGIKITLQWTKKKILLFTCFAIAMILNLFRVSRSFYQKHDNLIKLQLWQLVTFWAIGLSWKWTRKIWVQWIGLCHSMKMSFSLLHFVNLLFGSFRKMKMGLASLNFKQWISSFISLIK